MNPREPAKPLRISLVCTGVGVISRGIETFARDCFDGLHGRMPEGMRIELFKGVGPGLPPDEHRLPCLPRTGMPARLLGKMMRRTPYVAEQLSSLLPLLRRLRAERPDVVFTSEGNLRRWLYLLRPRLGLTCRILFSNGGPVNPPFPDSDHVQQTTPFHLQQALDAGEPPEKHSLVPYGIQVPAGVPESDPTAIAAIRRRLGLPVDQPIVLSVGSLSARDHKRMDYTIREVASLPAPRPFLVLLGQIDADGAPILAQARAQLGEGGHVARSVAADEVADYYRAADVFALGSLQEGFGRVYLEALMHGLPCAVNDHPIMRYVLGAEDTFADFSREGAMGTALGEILAARRALLAPDVRARRRESVRGRFGWETLGPQYLQMFQQAAILRGH